MISKIVRWMATWGCAFAVVFGLVTRETGSRLMGFGMGLTSLLAIYTGMQTEKWLQERNEKRRGP